MRSARSRVVGFASSCRCLFYPGVIRGDLCGDYLISEWWLEPLVGIVKSRPPHGLSLDTFLIIGSTIFLADFEPSLLSKACGKRILLERIEPCLTCGEFPLLRNSGTFWGRTQTEPPFTLSCLPCVSRCYGNQRDTDKRPLLVITKGRLPNPC